MNRAGVVKTSRTSKSELGTFLKTDNIVGRAGANIVAARTDSELPARMVTLRTNVLFIRDITSADP